VILNFQYRLLLSCCFFICQTILFAQEIHVVEVSKKKRASYQVILNRNKAVVTFIESALIQNGLPKMMRNLPLIESGFDKNVISSANAGGIWQFMEGYARRHGLKNADRFDIYHSTQTAMKILKSLYQKYGNWITVIAAYNCGEGNVKKAIDRANSDRYDKFYVYLPTETINHVHKFMEICTVTDELDFLITDYKLSAFKQTPQIKTEKTLRNDPALASTDINAAYSLDMIAEEMEIERADLLHWNPDIERELIKEGFAILYLPVDRMPDFLLLKNTILNRSIQSNVYHD
jgi:membrane-bound lytic murein transglycosylase D